MDFYENVISAVSAEIPAEWSEAFEVIHNFKLTKPITWKLPQVGFGAVSGSYTDCTAICSALAANYAAIILVDDLLDEDERGWQHKIGDGNAANIAVLFQTISTSLLMKLGVSSEIRETLLAEMNSMMRNTAFGQYLDGKNLQDEENYWRMIYEKSTPFFTAALKMGGAAAGADKSVMAHFELIGKYYGEVLQIHDDLKDAFEVPASPDWLLGRSSLPIMFASLVDHPEREAYISLKENAANPDALGQAQNILIRSGAVSYCLHEIMKRSVEVVKLIEQMDIRNQDILRNLFQDFTNPVEAFLEEIGIDPAYYQAVGFAQKA